MRTMSSLLDLAVFPGTQGGPLEHVIAAKAVSFGEDPRMSIQSLWQTDHCQCAGNG